MVSNSNNEDETPRSPIDNTNNTNNASVVKAKKKTYSKKKKDMNNNSSADISHNASDTNASTNQKSGKKNGINNKPILRMKKNVVHHITPANTSANTTSQHTTIVLSDEPENFIDIEQDGDSTYFTRTGIIQLNKDDVIMMNQQVGAYEHVFDEDQQRKQLISDGTKMLNDQMINSSHCQNKRLSIKNRFKRLRHVEVEDDLTHPTGTNPSSFLNEHINFTLENVYTTDTANGTSANNGQETVFHLVSLTDEI
jgi:hypothetical protein